MPVIEYLYYTISDCRLLNTISKVCLLLFYELYLRNSYTCNLTPSTQNGHMPSGQVKTWTVTLREFVLLVFYV